MNLAGIAQQRVIRQTGLEAPSDTGEGGASTREATQRALKKATTDFEAVFLNQMIAAMRSTVGDGSLIQKSNAEKIFEGMLDEEWSRKLAGRHGSRGLAAVLYQQLSRQMGLEDDASPVHEGTPPAVLDEQAVARLQQALSGEAMQSSTTSPLFLLPNMGSPLTGQK